MADGIRDGIKTIKKGDAGYPEQLLQIPRPPEILYCKGNIELLKKPMAAIIGSRKCSEYGKQVAMKLGRNLAEAGAVVLSGMAKGIDSFGHLGALRRGEKGKASGTGKSGETVAVLGCGVDICYPAENRKLYDEICADGLIISEYPPGTKPMPYMFPQRNRIIAGLAQVVTVVEAGRDSGALITATLAEEYGREVFAVPGNINSIWSLGTNKLIADGAMPVVVLDDVVRAMNLPALDFSAKSASSISDGLSELERSIVDLVAANGEVSLEFLCNRLGKNPVELNGIVMILEIKGILATNFGKIFVANF